MDTPTTSRTPEVIDAPSDGRAQTPASVIYTLPNAITLIRLMMVPFAFSVLVQGHHDILAFVLFACAGLSDAVDGQIARRTHAVSELGKILDPLVDRFLIAAGLIGLYVVGRLPLWIILVLILRDVYLFLGAFRIKSVGGPRIDVLFAGKATTVFLLAGFAGLILNLPHVSGLGWTHSAALPGWNSAPTVPWIAFVYIGMVLSLSTALAYTVIGWRAYRAVRR